MIKIVPTGVINRNVVGKAYFIDRSTINTFFVLVENNELFFAKYFSRAISFNKARDIEHLENLGFRPLQEWNKKLTNTTNEVKVKKRSFRRNK